MSTTATTRMFLVDPLDKEPILIVTDDIHGPEDQATLYDAFEERNVQFVAVPNSEFPNLPYRVFGSIEVLFREWFNIQLDRTGVAR